MVRLRVPWCERLSESSSGTLDAVKGVLVWQRSFTYGSGKTPKGVESGVDSDTKEDLKKQRRAPVKKNVAVVRFRRRNPEMEKKSVNTISCQRSTSLCLGSGNFGYLGHGAKEFVRQTDWDYLRYADFCKPWTADLIGAFVRNL